MSDETTDVTDEQPEAEAPLTDAEGDALAKLQQLMDDSQPLEYPDEPATEDADESDDDAGDETEAEGDEPEVQPPVAEGPSAALKGVARLSGLPQWMIDAARDDAQLQTFLDNAPAKPEDQPTPTADDPVEKFVNEPLVSLEFPEDEFDKDDPYVKKLQAIQDAVNQETKQQRQTLAIVRRFLEDQERQGKQAQFDQLRAPFDEFVDSLGSDLFGQTATMNDVQIQARRQAFAAYEKLDALQYLSDRGQLDRRVRAALTAEFPEIMEKHRQVHQQAQQQAKRKTGGGQAKPVQPPKSDAEKMRALERHMRYDEPLPIG